MVGRWRVAWATNAIGHRPSYQLQIFDVRYLRGADLRLHIPGELSRRVTSAYNSYLSDVGSAGQSGDDSINVLQGYLDDFTQIIQAVPKYAEQGQGGDQCLRKARTLATRIRLAQPMPQAKWSACHQTQRRRSVLAIDSESGNSH